MQVLLFVNASCGMSLALTPAPFSTCLLLYQRGVKPGDRYVSVICGNTKRKTAVVEDMSHFACPEVFHFLIKGAKSAVVEVLLKEKESIGNDKCLGSFKVCLLYTSPSPRD